MRRSERPFGPEKHHPGIGEAGSAFLLLLMLSLGLAAILSLLWQRFQLDWQILASHQERWRGRTLAEVGVEKAFAQLASDPEWTGTLQAPFPDGSSDRYHVTVTREGTDVTIRAYGVLASGYRSETLEVHLSLEERWPWEI